MSLRTQLFKIHRQVEVTDVRESLLKSTAKSSERLENKNLAALALSEGCEQLIF